MALTKCFECGHEVSTAAAACPNCGAPMAAANAKPPVTPSTPPSPTQPVPSPPVAPQPPPPPMPGGTGIFSQAKTYFLNLHPIAKTAWVFLAIGVLFTRVFEAAFWGLIIAAVLGVVVFFLKPRKDGLILVGAAILSTILLLGLSSHHAVRQPTKQLSHKQMLVNQL